MELSDVMKNVKNKGRMLVLGTVLSVSTYVSACADAPDNYTIVNGSGPNGSFTCEDIISDYLASCPGYNEEEKDAIKACHETNLPQIPGFTDCVYSANCNLEEVRLCYCYAGWSKAC